MYLSVSGIDFATVSMIIRMDFGIVATVNFLLLTPVRNGRWWSVNRKRYRLYVIDISFFVLQSKLPSIPQSQRLLFSYLFATVSMIIRMDFGIVATVNFFFFFSFYFINNIVYIMN
jgi:hypothetical protein